MIRVREWMIAGLTGIAAMMSANASALDCPEWLRWACSNSASSSPADVVPRERQRARNPVASSSQMDPKTQHVRAALDGATPQQTKRWETTRADRAGRNTGSPGDQRTARYAHDGKIYDQEREALFQEFSAWQKARRLDADANSDASGDQRSVVMNDREKEALFREFSAWQKARRLNVYANP